MSVESTTQALCDLALRFGEGDEESMVSWQFYSSFLCHWLSYTSLFYPVHCCTIVLPPENHL